MKVANAKLTANTKEIPQLTLRNIRKKAENVKESCRSAIRVMASKITQMRELILEKLKGILARRVGHKYQCALTLYPSSFTLMQRICLMS